MSGGHARVAATGLHLPGTSPIHRCGAAAKLAGLIGFVVVVAATPRTAVGALALDAVVVAALAATARIPARSMLARMAAIAPFVAFAFALPFIGTGDRVEVAGISMSVDGLWATWNIVAKASLGAAAGIVVTATTPLPDLIDGLRRLRVPAPMVSTVAVMVRYVDLLADQLHRMRRAMTARAHDPRWLWQAQPIAASVGTLFVRTYERGERVHLAMAARGFDGTAPAALAPPEQPDRPRAAWAAVPAAIALAGLAVAALP